MRKCATNFIFYAYNLEFSLHVCPRFQISAVSLRFVLISVKCFLNEDAESGNSFSLFMRRLSSIKTQRRTSINKDYAQCFDSKTLEKATGGFRDSNVIGQGGFGCVYKACFDKNVKAAIKKIENVSPEAKREFQVKITKSLVLIFGFFIFSLWFLEISEWSWVVEQDPALEHYLIVGLWKSNQLELHRLWADGERILRWTATW